MSLFTVFFVSASVLFTVAMLLYLHAGFTQRCAPFPLTVVATCAAWDLMQVIGVLGRFQLDYIFEVGFIIAEVLLLYLCYASRARHYPGVSAGQLSGYLFVVFTVSCLAIIGTRYLFDDSWGLISMAIAAGMLPVLAVARYRKRGIWAGHSPATAVLYAAATAMIGVAVVADPPPGAAASIVNDVVYATWILVATGYAWVVISTAKRVDENTS